MQLFVRDYCTVIAAPVQCDVDGIPKGSHYAKSSANGVAEHAMSFTPPSSNPDSFNDRWAPAWRSDALALKLVRGALADAAQRDHITDV
jgi:hypothetical protein